MKFTKLLKNITLLGVISIMTACGGSGKTAEAFKANPYDFLSTYRDMRITGIGYKAEQYTRYIDDSYHAEYVIENVRTLVVPIDFTDYPAAELPKGADGSREDLRKAMFGTEAETGWYSLAGYYNSSSFGKCNVSGKVVDWLHMDTTSKEFEAKYKGSENGYVAGTNDIAKTIEEYYLDHPELLGSVENGDDFNGDGKVDLRDYDANGDNYIDALIMIYSAPINTTGTMWWAYCSTRTSAGSNMSHPWMYRYFWCSFYFFYENYPKDTDLSGDNIVPDSHTMIHEFGHVLGLPDYYVTDYASGDYDSLGGMDMMDMNIGDHNAASKSWYGWTYPYVQDGKGTVTIRSTTDTGDYVIVPIKGKGWKNTLLDQYVMVEFITPTGVAYKDGHERLRSGYPLYYSKAGVRITLVDARLGVRNYNSTSGNWTFAGFTSTTTRPGDQSSVSLACENTASESCFRKFKLLEVLPATGKSIAKYGKGPQNSGDDTVLYQEGDVFGTQGDWKNFKVHDNSGEWTIPFGYKISIDKIDGNNSCTITVK